MAGAPGADQLVVDDVGRHPHQREIPAALPDDLVAGRERNEVGEAFQRHGIAVTDGVGNGFGKGRNTRHLRGFPVYRGPVFTAHAPQGQMAP